MSFQDCFSGHAADYARYRPGYPEELFHWLAQAAPDRDAAWDCATGNGQAALALAGHFHLVHATDASAQQLAAAPPHPGVRYALAPAEASGLADASVALVTVAQALHWFELDRFYAEVRRVLRPGGLLAAWCYGRLTIDEALDPLLDRFYRDLGPWWPPERHHIDTAYADLDFPFEPVASPKFIMEAEWTLPALLGYLSTWSALKAYQAARPDDPLAALAQRLAERWGEPDRPRRVSWPLSLRVGRQP